MILGAAALQRCDCGPPWFVTGRDFSRAASPSIYDVIPNRAESPVKNLLLAHATTNRGCLCLDL
jgi:hypothetical protein